MSAATTPSPGATPRLPPDESNLTPPQQRVLRRAVPRNVNGRMQYMTAAPTRPPLTRAQGPPGLAPFQMRVPPPQANQRVKVLRTVKDAVLFGAAIFIILFAHSRFGLVVACLVGTILLKMGFFSLLDAIRASFAQTFGTSHLALQESLRRADVMSEPIRAKSSEFVKGGALSFGFSCMQGWRRGMEDDHVMQIESDEKTAFFGVFDGHCGQTVATYCGKHLFNFVKGASKYDAKDYPHALKEGFVTLDKHIFKALRGERSGCTAVTLLVKTNDEGITKLFCANAGDSRCIVSRNGASHPLSEDHKPDLPREYQRIQNAGGFVARSRVNGSLALSRAIGDFSFKTNSTIPWEDQAVTSNPEVTEWTIDPSQDEFAVLACDGIWDVKTNENVVAFVRERIQRGVALDRICEEMMDDCLSLSPFGLGCDNMSVIIVTFNSHSFVQRYGTPRPPKVVEVTKKSPAEEAGTKIPHPAPKKLSPPRVLPATSNESESSSSDESSSSTPLMSPSTVQATTGFPGVLELTSTSIDGSQTVDEDGKLDE